jgi:hypothetical protein
MAEVKISQTELQDWTNHVKAEHSSIKKTGREMVKKAMSLGDYLKEKKDRLGYGKFLPWVETDCEVDIRTVQRYMKAAENRVVIEKYIADVSKYDTVSHLTLRGALALVAKDKRTPPTPAVKYENAEKRLLGLVGTLPPDQVADHIGKTIQDLQEVLARVSKPQPPLRMVSPELKTGTTG